MTNSEKQQIRKIQSVLQNIDNGINIFFNIAQYEKFGLVVTRNKWITNAVGNKVKNGHSFHLTEKAKNYLKIVI